jgi:hypothetical protein
VVGLQPNQKPRCHQLAGEPIRRRTPAASVWSSAHGIRSQTFSRAPNPANHRNSLPKNAPCSSLQYQKMLPALPCNTKECSLLFSSGELLLKILKLLGNLQAAGSALPAISENIPANRKLQGKIPPGETVSRLTASSATQSGLCEPGRFRLGDLIANRRSETTRSVADTEDSEVAVLLLQRFGKVLSEHRRVRWRVAQPQQGGAFRGVLARNVPLP